MQKCGHFRLYIRKINCIERMYTNESSNETWCYSLLLMTSLKWPCASIKRPSKNFCFFERFVMSSLTSVSFVDRSDRSEGRSVWMNLSMRRDTDDDMALRTSFQLLSIILRFPHLNLQLLALWAQSAVYLFHAVVFELLRRPTGAEMISPVLGSFEGPDM